MTAPMEAGESRVVSTYSETITIAKRGSDSHPISLRIFDPETDTSRDLWLNRSQAMKLVSVLRRVLEIK